MRMRSLACNREVGFGYDIPLTRVSKFSEPYADSKVVAAVGQYISQARDAIELKYPNIVKVDTQLDHDGELDDLEREIVTGYSFRVGFDRVDKNNISAEILERAVFDFIDMIPLKPIAGSAPSKLFEKIREYKHKNGAA